ncbi:T6SS phospholipase effector Tle1-like catalytic domain-containing protein [Marinobacter sp. 1Y8]
MKVKSRLDLQLQDLPLIEKPSLARFHADKLIDDPFSDVPEKPGIGKMSARELEEAIANGSLFVVFSSLLHPPISPIVTWNADRNHLNGGRWRLMDGLMNPALTQEVEALNQWNVTPETISLVGPGCAGHLSASGFDSTMVGRRADERAIAKQEAQRKLTLPLGAAASVAPIAVAAYNTPDNEKKPEPKTRKPIHLEVGIFTDGTLNNAGNIDVFRQRVEDECLIPHQDGDIDEAECERRLGLLLGDSYANGTSNIAKLWNLYPDVQNEKEDAIIQRFPVYMPGAGSKTGKPDSLKGMMTGLGDTGVISQIKSVFLDIALRAGDVADDGIIDTLTIDLFGFSRGAAAARHASNDIISGAGGELGKTFAANGIQWPESVTIRFLGLFDTVAGIVNIREGDFTASNDSNAPVKLYIDPTTISSAVQFTAIDECRENFALNSLYRPDGTLPENFREIALPGAHSDIGGGYHDSQTEQLLLSPTLSIKGSDTAWPEQAPQWDNLATLKSAADAEGWVGPHTIPLSTDDAASIRIYQTVREHPRPDGQVDLDLKLRRQVRGGLSQVYLHCMHELANRAGVPLGKMDPTDSGTAIPKELDLTYRLVREQIRQGRNLPSLPESQKALLKQRYVHHSDHYNLTEFLIGDTIGRAEIPLANATLISPFRPAAGRKRILYSNKPEY